MTLSTLLIFWAVMGILTFIVVYVNDRGFRGELTNLWDAVLCVVVWLILWPWFTKIYLDSRS